MDRRSFSKILLESMTSYALLDALWVYEAMGIKARPILDHWAMELNQYCSDLRTNAITPLQWQELTKDLFEKIELSEILKFIDFDRLIKGFSFPDLGVKTKAVQFPKLAGLPEKTAFVKKIFGMKKDRAIIPHGHSHMASAHLVLNGEMHLRHYQKVGDDGSSLIIQPTIDRIAQMGDSSSISDEKDNVHWFIANTETAFTLDVIMLDLNHQTYDIHNLDIYEAEDLKNGSLRAPILDVNAALKKYGKHHH